MPTRSSPCQCISVTRWLTFSDETVFQPSDHVGGESNSPSAPPPRTFSRNRSTSGSRISRAKTNPELDLASCPAKTRTPRRIMRPPLSSRDSRASAARCMRASCARFPAPRPNHPDVAAPSRIGTRLKDSLPRGFGRGNSLWDCARTLASTQSRAACMGSKSGWEGFAGTTFSAASRALSAASLASSAFCSASALRAHAASSRWRCASAAARTAARSASIAVCCFFRRATHPYHRCTAPRKPGARRTGPSGPFWSVLFTLGLHTIPRDCEA